VLDVELHITNPYLYKTKAEVVATVPDADRIALRHSVSCWRGARVSSANHCGDCVPCLVRRIAFEHNNIVLAEYKRDLFASDIPSLPEDDEGKRNLVELAEFAYAFGVKSAAELEHIFPDLISSDFNQTDAIEMYRRFAAEAHGVLSRYPGPKKLLTPSSLSPAQRPKKAPKL
jgi:hypothetical protein